MKSLGVTRFEPPDDQFTGTDDPMEADRRLPDWSAQLTNFGVGRQGKMPKDSFIHLRLYAEPKGTTIASGAQIVSPLWDIVFPVSKNRESRFHQMFIQAWQELDSSITIIDYPGYLL